jgi:hypothetical protein
MNSGVYVWALKDPRLPAGANIVYVGSGQKPWESVKRHLERSSNPLLLKWVEDLHTDFPEGIEILGQVVADRWHGDPVEIPPAREGITRVEWAILDYEDPVESSDPNAIPVPLGSRKAYWIKRFRDEGHPLLNRDVGRPRVQARRPVSIFSL